MLSTLSTLTYTLLLISLGTTLWLHADTSKRKFLLPALALMLVYTILDQLLLSFPAQAHTFLPLRLSVQLLLCPAWLVFSRSYARVVSVDSFQKTDFYLFGFSLLPFILSLFIPTASFYYQTDFQVEPIIFFEQASFYLYLYVIIIYIISIGNLESTLRNSKHSEEWRIKISLLGIGISILSLMFFASQGLLYKIIDMRNLPLRNIGLCFGAVLILYSEWKRKSNEVQISRKVAFRSLVAAIAGIYLVGLGLAREYNRLTGGSFIQSILMISTAVLLCGIVGFTFSQSLRRTLTIWVQRNFYDEKYDYRGQWMQFSEHLSRAVDYKSLVDTALMNFCETFGRLGAIYIPIDTENPNIMGKSFYYEISKDTEITFSNATFSQLVKLDPTPFFVNDKNSHTIPPQIVMQLLRMQIGVVLPIHATDSSEGLLLLGHPINGKEKYDHEDSELMEAMGRQIGLSAKGFRLSEEMALNREIQAFDKLGTFVLHDLKNQVYALSLLTNNARNFITDPAFQTDMVETLSNTVNNMKTLISQLGQLPNADNLRMGKVYLRDLAEKICSQIPNAPITITGKNPSVTLDSDQFGKVFFNLYLNALEAGDNKPIDVIIDEEEGIPVFHVRDMAGGLAPKILEAGIFKPFNTTKPRGMGIGLFHSRKIVEAHGAQISVENRPGEGCTFTVRFEKEQS